jgi:hypothetical protein
MGKIVLTYDELELRIEFVSQGPTVYRKLLFFFVDMKNNAVKTFVYKPICERKRTKSVTGLGPTNLLPNLSLHTLSAAQSYTHMLKDYLATLSMSDVTRR